jgi:HNH endonuclease
VHIAFRTSGGRGEYEVVGQAGSHSASELEGWSFYMRWPDGLTRDTELWIDSGASGKTRLRSLASPPYQIGRMVAAMLLLPTPRRSLHGAPSGLPVAKRNQYLVTRIGFGPDTEFDSSSERVTFEPNYVEISNKADADLIGVDNRWHRITAVYAASTSLSDSVRSLVTQHQTTLAHGSPIPRTLNRQVDRLLEALLGLGAPYEADTDPLPALERQLGVVPTAVPELPPPNEIGADEIDVRVEAAAEYRLARSRGASGRSFAAAVKAAYKNRCAFCGLAFGGIEGIISGIDAAHILAWSSYDLDVLRNGIALCKLHHWAFDAGIMLPVLGKDGNYTIAFTELACRLDPDARVQLGTDDMTIPDGRLPTNKADRPSPKYLSRLYDDLGIRPLA